MVKRESDIMKALSAVAADDGSNNELYLQYQPIMDLKTGLIVGFEALARLRAGELGSISPLEFIPVAEKTKLIIPVGDKVIAKALHFLSRLRMLGYGKVFVSINISAFQLLSPDFSNKLLKLISKMRVDPANVCLEITESVFFTDFDSINNIIRELRDIGLYIAIDDFGTGYSSLAREKGLNVDCMKIDKYFIDGLLSADRDKAITGDIISIAHKLGHCAVAEGVEHEIQLRYLREHNCDRIQGNLISRPLDEDEAIEFLRWMQ